MDGLRFAWQRLVDGEWVVLLSMLALLAIMACYDAGIWSPIWWSWEKTRERRGWKDGGDD